MRESGFSFCVIESSSQQRVSAHITQAAAKQGYSFINFSNISSYLILSPRIYINAAKRSFTNRTTSGSEHGNLARKSSKKSSPVRAYAEIRRI